MDKKQYAHTETKSIIDFNDEGRVLRDLLDNHNVFYIVVETEFTKHHIEKLMATCKDRGSIKWIAETKYEAFEHMNKGSEARTSVIDNADLFPRLYFLADSFIVEFFMWCKRRNLTITNITAPAGYQRINGSVEDIVGGEVTPNEDGFTIDWKYKDGCVQSQ